MKATRATACIPYEGDDYQFEAFQVASEISVRDILPWTWWSTDCGFKQCLQYDHLVGTAPRKIAYPDYVCVYCGLIGGTRDHLLPRNITGNVSRAYVATVPACAQCNSAIGDFPSCRITERRAVAHAHLRRKYSNILVPVPLDGLEGRLRQFVQAAHAKRDQVEARLAWPDEFDYDLRAFQKSGIQDPYGMGLI